ncbi:MAG: type II/IV secretion system ATPase subunit, partial [Candidatus Methanoperedenaceae archaeon]|nr:type II/IV secretion system ATPase subunit [Candidatus Methanoperedenaceae archaeon]
MENPLIELPFEVTEIQEENEDLTKCSVFRMLPKDAKAHVEKQLHVLQYIHMLPLDKIGIPKYYAKLSKELNKLKDVNLIYPVSDHVTVHIYPDERDIRNYYIPIEPSVFRDMDALLLEVDTRLADLVSEGDGQDIKTLLETGIAKICLIKEDAGVKRFFNFFKKDKRLVVTRAEFNALKYLVVRDKVGMGVLEPFLKDPYIEDITCDGVGHIFIEHKIFESLKSPVGFRDCEALDRFVLRLSEKIGKPVSYSAPIVDATLLDGSRVNVVFGKDISKKGSNFTIRKFIEPPLSVLNLIEFGTLDYRMAAYLWIMLNEGMNLFICGETASGKTTTMNALTAFIPPNSKIVSIEDTAELQVPHKNWTREVTRGRGKGGSSDVGMFDLLRAALRQRPNEIIIGEIRGEEGNIAFQAMQTGHSVISTFHAASVEKLIQRISSPPISVPRAYIDNLNLVVIQNAVRDREGKLKRRITNI